MGGFAAKQRRRVERQSLQRPSSEFDDDQSSKRSTFANNKNNDNDSKKKPQLKLSGESSLHRRVSQPQRSKFKIESPRRHVNKSVPPATKKKDVHKPKHLKRKIESIIVDTAAAYTTGTGSISTDETIVNLKEKERLLQQLEDFQRQKQQLRQNNTPTSRTPPINTNKTMTHDRVAGTSTVNTKIWTNGNKLNTASAVPVSKILDVERKDEPMPTTKSTIVPLSQSNTNSRADIRTASTIVSHSNKTAGLTTDKPIVRKADGLQNAHSDEDDDNDEVLLTDCHRRQRGKRLRRRGVTTGPSDGATGDVMVTSGHHDEDDTRDLHPTNNSTTNFEASCTQQQQQQQQQRRCIGRKPVTDYVIGQSYTGTVVYTKPFGIFIDIGCHSDAFCHVSQLSTTFIENPIDEFLMGAKLEKVRIVEIDRKKKRITVSLKKGAEPEPENEKMKVAASTNGEGATHPSEIENKKIELNGIVETKEHANHSNDPTLKSTAEQLRRDRKLARRAERRSHSTS